MFHTLTYNDSEEIDVDNIDCSTFKDSYIKIFVESKKQPYTFDRFMNKLYDAGVAKITTVEDVIDSE